MNWCWSDYHAQARPGAENGDGADAGRGNPEGPGTCGGKTPGSAVGAEGAGNGAGS